MSTRLHRVCATARNGVLVDAWYAEALRPFGAIGIDEAIAARFAAPCAWLARRSTAIRGLLWFAVSRKAERVVCPFSAPGLLVFLTLHRLFSPHPPGLFLVEFLRGEPRSAWARAKEFVHTRLFRTLLPPMLCGAQVMTGWEASAYAKKYELPQSLFTFIAFPMVLHPGESLPAQAPAAEMVLSSGRAACDWPTLMAAAQDADWPLTIVCSSEDRATVDALNRSGRARVLSEISHQEHQQLLSQATVYALVLREQRASSGQVRLARAIESGVPVVATAVLGLDGYVEDGCTALAVPVGDAARLRAAIDTLWNDSARRTQLRHRAHSAMHDRSLAAYTERIRAFVNAEPHMHTP
ncbi:MAG: glycosyltransferase [Rhizobacter sp.]